MTEQNRADAEAPTAARTEEERLAVVLERNIQAMVRRRKAETESAGLEDRLASIITSFAGSMKFVYLHIVIVGFWIAANLGWVPLVRPWDPSLVVLAMAASVEAIFLTSFVLISQNRMVAADDRRADLDLQISLLAEHEATQIITMISAIAAHLNIATGVEDEMDDLKKNAAPEAVLDEIEKSGRSRG